MTDQDGEEPKIERSWVSPTPGHFQCFAKMALGPGSQLFAVFQAVKLLMERGVPPDAYIHISGEYVYAQWQETTTQVRAT